MKKIISIIAGLSLLPSAVPYTVIGADAEPADIGKAAYDQLMEVSWKYDKNSDNVITMDELKGSKSLEEVFLEVYDDRK